MIPRVEKIYNIEEKYGVVTIDALTDRGSAKVEIRNILHGMKLLYGTRVLLRDGNDSQYEIPNLMQLDKRSRLRCDQIVYQRWFSDGRKYYTADRYRR